MEHCEPKYTGTDTNHLLYHQPTDGAPHDNTPPVVCITAAEIIYPCPRIINGALWTEIHSDRHQSFAISPTHGRSPTRQYPPGLYVAQRQRLFIHALEESMEHCEPKYTGTDTNHLLYHQPTDGAPHDNTPPGLYVSQRQRLFIHALEESMEHCEPKYTGTDTNHLLYHQPTDGAPHDNTPPGLYVSQRQRLFIHALDQWSTVNRNTQGHQSFISLSVLSPTHGRSPTRQYPAVVCITAAEIIYPCPTIIFIMASAKSKNWCFN